MIESRGPCIVTQPNKLNADRKMNPTQPPTEDRLVAALVLAVVSVGIGPPVVGVAAANPLSEKY